MLWSNRRRPLDLARRGAVLGILNVTPDSFSDGGQHLAVERAVAHGLQMLAEGAEIIDVGGESTRPGAAAVGAEEELQRVLPVVRGLRAAAPEALLSIDTSKAVVAEAALAAGADIINDITALRGDPAMRALAASSGAGVCLMHMQGEPGTMQAAPHYDDVVTDVRRFLAERLAVLAAAGVAAERVVLDPGIGFGKTPQHNLQLAARQRELLALGRPLLLGWSRKSTLGVVTGRPVAERLPASLAAALSAVVHGATVLRVHDVAATVDALKVWRAIDEAGAAT
ncbi:MAG: dihydropteroate synthase [Verrucomicrobia bacterium]|nr:dihydropteroate synthase [Verrucomicrobiota bacterium]